jgi:hypothetical protein
VYESRAICKYFEKKFAAQGTALMPKNGDVKVYGLFEQVSLHVIKWKSTQADVKLQACSIEQNNFNPYAFCKFELGSDDTRRNFHSK